MERRRVEDKVYTWPHLVRLEFLCIIIALTVLIIWSITVDAPLEGAANPTKTPNPSKAPWYFLGLQEMLVYFDPWIAGVVLPSLIIIGLMLIPYLDVNPKGNGYYTFTERKFAILTYFFGFLFLWVFLIIIGVFFRGPGWNFFWPWQRWDPRKVVAITNVNLSYWGPFKYLGNPKLAGVELVGLVVLTLYYSSGLFYYLWRKDRSPTLQQMGLLRYAIVAFLFLTMILLPIKISLRIFFNIKYIWVTPWFNI